ncbi:MAG TPA: nitrate- and nitrite sensing domain-containing protein, partial [Stenomitos sp.]
MIRGLKIRFILMAMIGLLALMAGALLLKEGSRVATDAQKTEWLQQANRMADDILTANGAEAQERGLTAEAISHPRTVSAVTREQIRQRRAAGDAAYQDALGLAQRMAAGKAGHPLTNSLAQLDERRKRLESLRSEVDRAFETQVPTVAPKEWIAACTDFIDALAQVRRDAFTARDSLDEAYRNNLQIKELIFLAAEHAGRERATIGAVIAQGRSLTPEEKGILARNRAIVDQNLDTLQRLTQQAEPGSRLGVAVQAMKGE